MLDTLRHTFVQDSANNSLDAALLHLPMQMPAAVQWMIDPAHWSLAALGVVGLSLLFGVWLADTLELALLFNSWLLLFLVLLLPVFWPWYLLPPLALALCAAHRHTLTLLLLLCLCGLLIYYSWLWPIPWAGSGLLTLGGPLLLWGWVLFFTSTWQMTSKHDAEQLHKRRGNTQSIPSFSRPSWLSRPSRPGRSRF